MKKKIRTQYTSRLQIGKTQVKIRFEENREKISQRQSEFRFVNSVVCVQIKIA